MKIFEPLLKEIKQKQDSKDIGSCEMETLIKKVSTQLLDAKYKPSKSLEKFFDKLLRRSKYPMEVAIVGQFSSGKSTFLNALLGRDILPTGITPVTSKVNFINYGDEYKMEVTYNSGAKEFHTIEHLAKFTDQRESPLDIKYLSLFAPLEILKDISFVDTPGLNSQSSFDTKTTINILRSVDGIIWLGLIDAVAKKTELDILEEYMNNYASKSICLLNQKDRISEDEVKIALDYAKENYRNFFSKIVAISAKDALEARINKECLKRSNMQDVLDFINNEIRPNAKEAKLFSLKQTIKSAIILLQDEYTSLTSLYEDLVEILEEYIDGISDALKELDAELTNNLELLNVNIQECIEFNVKQIYSNIKVVTKSFAKEEKSILGKKLVQHEYKSFELLVSRFDKSRIKNIQESLESMEKLTLNILEENIGNFEKKIILWKMRVVKSKKICTIASDDEREELKYFAFGVYEEIYKDYQKKLQEYEANLIYKKNRLSLLNRFELAYEKTISQINIEIIQMQNSYEKDTLHSVINSIDESELILKFKENLDFEYLKRELRVDDSFVNSALQTYDKDLAKLLDESVEKIKVKFSLIDHKVKDLDNILL